MAVAETILDKDQPPAVADMKSGGALGAHVVAVALLLAAIGAAWARLVTTPGNFNTEDLAWPLTAWDHWREHYPLWSAPGYANEAIAPRFFFNLPFVALAQLFGGGGGAYLKLMLLATATSSAVAAYFGIGVLARLIMPQFVHAHQWPASLAAVLGAALYSFNPWSMARVEHFYIWAGLSVAPLVLALVVRGIVLGRRRPLIAAAALHAFVGSITPHSAAFGLAIVAAAGVYHVAVGFAPRPFAVRARRSISGMAEFAVVYLLASSFFWLPLAARITGGSDASPGYLIVQQDLVELVKNQSWLNTVRLVGSWSWSDALQPADPREWGWEVFSLVPLSALLVGLFAGRPLWRATAFFLTLAASAALLIAATAAPPLASTFRERIVLFPFGWMVREPDKVAGTLALAYSFGVGLLATRAGAALAYHHPLQPRVRRAALWAFFIAAFAVLFVYVRPAVQGMLWTPVTAFLPRTVPADYVAVARMLNSVPPERAGRALVLAGAGARVWSELRRVDPFLARSLARRSVSNMTVLGATFAERTRELIVAGGDPRALLRAAGIGVVVVERDHSVGREVGDWLRKLAYPVVYDGEFVTAVQVPGEPSAPDQADSEPAVAVAGAARLVAGLPSISDAAAAAAAVTTDLDPPTGATLSGIRDLVVAEPSTAAAEAAFLTTPGLRLMPLMGATLNNDAATGWARGRAAEVNASRWRQTLRRLGLSNWQFDLGLGLLYTQTQGDVRLRLPAGPAAGRYQAWAKVFVSPAGDHLRILIAPKPRPGSPAEKTPAQADGAVFADLPTRSQESLFVWRALGPLTIQAGDDYEATLESGFGLAAVNALALVPAAASTPALPTRTEHSATPPQIGWRKATATKYQVAVTGARDPFLLILHEHFDPQWIARVGGKTVRPILTAGISNGYAMTKTGDYEITLEYSGQRMYDLGLLVSIGVGLAVLLYLIARPPRRLTRPRRRFPRPAA